MAGMASGDVRGRDICGHSRTQLSHQALHQLPVGHESNESRQPYGDVGRYEQTDARDDGSTSASVLAPAMLVVRSRR